MFHSTPAALIVALVVLMRLPGMVAPRILPAESCGAGNLGLAGAELGGAASAAGGIFTLVSIAFAVTVGLRLAQRHPYPLLHGQRNGWRRVGLAALSGAVLGVISLWAFATLGVEASGTFET